MFYLSACTHNHGNFTQVTFEWLNCAYQYSIALFLFQKVKYVNDMHSTFQESFSVAWNEKLSCED